MNIWDSQTIQILTDETNGQARQMRQLHKQYLGKDEFLQRGLSNQTMENKQTGQLRYWKMDKQGKLDNGKWTNDVQLESMNKWSN